ncbi:6-bladed beta-propeller [Parabacteroides sp. AM08-6]|uniref:6-bladed beta-propeller n=1 Tax=Parabacteroides sp. AM08-6 TaxID=2292053 RepID=UPI000EFE39D4|nr:6-bladed beta-propeller [Parabacteroides sp. AM08-6]RHJ86545.1 6-bladed beta-propeller [Parabacteroides sp. AM08-6]
MKKLICTLLLPIFFFSCNNKEEAGGGQTLKVDLDTPYDELSFFDIFESVDVVPLETTDSSLIGEISKIDFYKNQFYILDERTMSVFRFNRDGRYCDKIARHGKGPGEYSDLTDFSINRETNQIELLSAYGGLHIYDMDFNHVRDLKLTDPKLYPVHKFANVSSDLRVFLSYFKEYRLKLHSEKQNKVIKEFYKRPVFLAEESVMFTTNFMFEKEGDVVYFNQASDYNLYEITPDTCKIRQTWDFGEHNYSISTLPSDWKYQQYSDYFWKDMVDKKKVFFFISNMDNLSYQIAKFSYEKKNVTVIYDKKSSKYIKMLSFKENVLFPHYSKFKNDSLLISTLEFSFHGVEEMLNYCVNSEIIGKNRFNELLSAKEDTNPYVLVHKIRNDIFNK